MWLIGSIDAAGTAAPRLAVHDEIRHWWGRRDHAFWSPDGRRVYFDHQVPDRAGDYYIGGIEVATGTMRGYPIAHADWGLQLLQHLARWGDVRESDGDDGDAGFSRKTLLLYRIVNGGLQVEPLADLSASDLLHSSPNVHFTRGRQVGRL